MRLLTDKEIRNLGFDPAEYDRMYALNGTNTYIRYVKGYYSGFISHGKVITPPTYTPSARLVAGRYIIADIFKFTNFHNKSMLIDAMTGEILVEGFGAYFLQNDTYLGFRVNGKNMSDHRWGVFSLEERKLVHTPNLKYVEIHPYVDQLIGKED